ncbi:MAG: exopolysaccharide biosynthesis polyprenyl glycosylphosphotransferase [Alphaproteobacteria bacterium]|nr:exopolysaccharide biosynthesis polyprenyl glycosylphosphotransferase [Alphaproteobacteria bacterium]
MSHQRGQDDAGGHAVGAPGRVSTAAMPELRAPVHWRLMRISWPLLAGLLAVADIAVVLGAALAAFVGHVGFVLHGWYQWGNYLAVTGLAVTLMAFIWHAASIYSVRILAKLQFQVRWTLALWGLGLLLMAGFGFFLQASSQFSRIWVAMWTVLGGVGLVANRLVLTAVASHLIARGLLVRRVALIASPERMERMRARFEAPAVRNLYHIGLARAPADGSTAAFERTVDEVVAIGRGTPFDIVCVATDDLMCPAVTAGVERLRDLTSDVWVAFNDPPERMLGLGVIDLAGLPILEAEVSPMKDWSVIVKAIEDRVLGGVLLLLAAPILLVAAIAIRLESPGPVFFRQNRLGFNNRPFEIWKLRTMYIDRSDPSGEASTTRDDSRVTRVGRFLRRTSLDELPQLLNVLDGSMSLVGPRAHPVKMRVADHYYHERFSRYAARHKVKPGLTGLAQVNGNRGQVDSEEKATDRLRHDLTYVRNWSLALDLKILARTPGALIFGRDAY